MENKLRHTILDGPTSDDFFKSYYYSRKSGAFFYVTFKTKIGEFTCGITSYSSKDVLGKKFKFKGVDDCDRTFAGEYNVETKNGWIEW